MKLKGLKKVCTATRNIANGCVVAIWVNPNTLEITVEEVLCGTLYNKEDGTLYVGTAWHPMTMDDIKDKVLLRLQLEESMRSKCAEG